MKKRIQELMEQSIDYACANQKSMDTAMEKFAELILAECIKVVDDTPLGYGDYRDQILESMRNRCSVSIKNHFGVE